MEENPSLVPWDLLPESLKASNRDQVAHVRVKLFAIGCDLVPAGTGPGATLTLAEIERFAKMEHERWSVHHRSEGWVFGPHKDADARTTPYLVAWDDLSEDAREIDREFARSLPDLVGRMGKKIVRIDAP